MILNDFHFVSKCLEGDLELIVQELKALQGGERWTPEAEQRANRTSLFLKCDNRLKRIAKIV